MDRDMVETDEDLLAFEVPDDALERAAVITELQATTIEFALTGITAAGRYSSGKSHRLIRLPRRRGQAGEAGLSAQASWRSFD